MAIANVTTILGAETVPCAAGESVECGFNVSNESAKSVRLSVETRTEGGTQEGWLEVLGDIERELPESGNDQVTVHVKLPKGTPEGKYPFRLRVYATDNPEQFAESPAVAVEVPAPAEPHKEEEPKKPFPWWIVAVAAAVLVIGGVVTAMLLSGGPKVPTLKDLTLDAAIEELDKEGLTLGTVTEKITGQADGGVVLGQSPEPDVEVEKNSSVELTIEAVSVEVPNVVGLHISKAQDALVAAGLRSGNIGKQKRADQRGGMVLDQKPDAGQRVLPGFPVNLTVVDQVIIVPSMIGQTYKEATATLAGQGLSTGKVSHRRTGGTRGVVLSHTPPANKKVPPGAKVDLVLEENTVPVPDVMNKDVKSATKIVKNGELNPVPVPKPTNNAATVNKVITQVPPAKTRVPPGTPVQLVFGIYVPTVSKSTGLQVLPYKAIAITRDAGTLRVVPPEDEE